MKKMLIQIRIEALTEQYLEQALKLQNRIFHESFSIEYLRDLMQNPNYIYQVLLQDEKVIGILCYMKTAFEAELIDIAIENEYRGLGFGKVLLNEMIAEVRKSDIFEIFLEVRRNNVVAVGLYEKVGFEELGIRKDYYSNPSEDAILMKMVLNPEIEI